MRTSSDPCWTLWLYCHAQRDFVLLWPLWCANEELRLQQERDSERPKRIAWKKPLISTTSSRPEARRLNLCPDKKQQLRSVCAQLLAFYRGSRRDIWITIKDVLSFIFVVQTDPLLLAHTLRLCVFQRTGRGDNSIITFVFYQLSCWMKLNILGVFMFDRDMILIISW